MIMINIISILNFTLQACVIIKDNSSAGLTTYDIVKQMILRHTSLKDDTGAHIISRCVYCVLYDCSGFKMCTVTTSEPIYY